MQRRAFCVAAVVAAASITWTSAALAAYPDKPIRVVVPYPAGGAADTIARVFGERLAAIAGQPVIVENKGGASGMIGPRQFCEPSRTDTHCCSRRPRS